MKSRTSQLHNKQSSTTSNSTFAVINRYPLRLRPSRPSLQKSTHITHTACFHRTIESHRDRCFNNDQANQVKSRLAGDCLSSASFAYALSNLQFPLQSSLAPSHRLLYPSKNFNRSVIPPHPSNVCFLSSFASATPSPLSTASSSSRLHMPR
jgi:hypothetical protein